MERMGRTTGTKSKRKGNVKASGNVALNSKNAHIISKFSFSLSIHKHMGENKHTSLLENSTFCYLDHFLSVRPS